jgi:hypothetical protein
MNISELLRTCESTSVNTEVSAACRYQSVGYTAICALAYSDSSCDLLGYGIFQNPLTLEGVARFIYRRRQLLRLCSVCDMNE